MDKKSAEEVRQFIQDRMDSRDKPQDGNSFMAGVMEGIRETCEYLEDLVVEKLKDKKKPKGEWE